ncbi:MAG: hypothetical protein RIE77_09620 [Phycisphaerales bacterium]|jgi:hypothetical protein
MMRLVGWIFLLIGLGLMITGLGMALQGYVHIIHEAVSNPLAEGAASDEPEKAQAGAMLRWAIVGLAGVPFAAVGALLTLKSRLNRMRAKRLAAGR